MNEETKRWIQKVINLNSAVKKLAEKVKELDETVLLMAKMANELDSEIPEVTTLAPLSNALSISANGIIRCKD